MSAPTATDAPLHADEIEALSTRVSDLLAERETGWATPPTRHDDPLTPSRERCEKSRLRRYGRYSCRSAACSSTCRKTAPQAGGLKHE